MLLTLDSGYVNTRAMSWLKVWHVGSHRPHLDAAYTGQMLYVKRNVDDMVRASGE